MSERRPSMKVVFAGIVLVAIGASLFWWAHARETALDLQAHSGNTDLRWLGAGACTVIGLLVAGVAVLARRKPPTE